MTEWHMITNDAQGQNAAVLLQWLRALVLSSGTPWTRISHSLSLGALTWPWPGSHACDSQARPKIKIPPVSRFPAAQIPWMAGPEQVTSERTPEETGGCLLCREPTFKQKKALITYDHSEVSE